MKDYQSLPDILSLEEVTTLLQEILTAAGSAQPPSRLETASSLFEMAQRQWHTYEPLDAAVRPGLESWIKANWDASQDGTLLNYLTSVIVTLKLAGCVSLLEQAAAADTTPAEVRQKLKGALEEYNEPAEVY